MSTRLLLCPTPKVFIRATAASSLLTNLGYIIGSIMGPILFSFHSRLPFLIASIAYSLLLLIMLCGYYRRKQFLAKYFKIQDINKDYLEVEKLFYSQSKNTIKNDNLSKVASQIAK
eukprot:219875_1